MVGSQPPTACGYWSDRESGFDLAGVGRADVLTGGGDAAYGVLIEQLRERMATSRRPLRYFGGGGFTGRAPSESMWRPFGACRFVLPRFEIEHENGRTIFACNLKQGDTIEQVLTEVKQLRLPVKQSEYDTAIPNVIHRVDTPEKKVLAKLTLVCIPLYTTKWFWPDERPLRATKPCIL